AIGADQYLDGISPRGGKININGKQVAKTVKDSLRVATGVIFQTVAGANKLIRPGGSSVVADVFADAALGGVFFVGPGNDIARVRRVDRQGSLVLIARQLADVDIGRHGVGREESVLQIVHLGSPGFSTKDG